MVSLRGQNIKLRALEQRDLDFLYQLENDPTVWEISGTITPYSKDVLQFYLDNAHRDIYDVKQLRLVICKMDDMPLGFIDLFDFDPNNKRAGVGIIVMSEKDRNKGIGGEALQILCRYAFDVLQLRQLYANILEENTQSIHLFEKLGFELVGIKKDWISSNGKFKNELLFQKINK